ncbi:MAG TPA: hypothetical protein VIL46_00580, partial [Gemmataceae bacterium]
MRRSDPLLLCVLLLLCALCGETFADERLPGTEPLTREGDIAAQMVEGIDRYLMRELAASVGKREQFWKPDFSSPEAYRKSVEPNRERLKKIIGVMDERLPPRMEYVGGPDHPALVAETDRYKVYAVRWAVLPGVEGEGLLLEPTGKAVANVVAIPDADQTPEQLVGMAPGVEKGSQFARRLAENGCRVVVPVLISRDDTFSGNPGLGRMTNQPHREFVYRMAYQMGRHVIGYEVQKVLAAVDWFCRDKGHAPVGLWGYGEGGLLAFYAGAIDGRVAAAGVSGYFGPREGVWEEPIYRNVWGLLREFGDGQVGRLYGGRQLVIHQAEIPGVSGPPGVRDGRRGAAPGRIVPPDEAAAMKEFDRSEKWAARLGQTPAISNLGFEAALKLFLPRLAGAVTIREPGDLPADSRKDFDPAARQKRQFDQLVAYTQKLWRDSDRVRDKFWSRADASSVGAWETSTQWYRDYFWEEVIGKLPPPDRPMSPKSRPIYDTPKWRGYEV